MITYRIRNEVVLHEQFFILWDACQGYFSMFLFILSHLIFNCDYKQLLKEPVLKKGASVKKEEILNIWKGIDIVTDTRTVAISVVASYVDFHM